MFFWEPNLLLIYGISDDALRCSDLLHLVHEPQENKKVFLIQNVKNCKGTSSLHRSKFIVCIETPLFTVIKVYM